MPSLSLPALPRADLRAFAAWPYVPLALALAYAALVPGLRLVPTPEAYDGQRLAELALLIGAAVALACSGEGVAAVWRGFSRAARAGWLVLGGLGAASALASAAPREGALEVGHLALVLLLAFAVAAAVRRAPETAPRAILFALGAGVLLNALGAAVAYAMHVGGAGTPLWPRAGLGFSHVRHFNHLQTWTLALLALPVLGVGPNAPAGARRGLARRTFAGALLAVWWVLAFASGGRATLVAVAVGAAFATVAFGRAALPWLRVHAGAAFAGGGLYGLLFLVVARSRTGIASRVSLDDSDRFVHWAFAWAQARAHPALGLGPMQYARVHPAGMGAHPHNFPLQMAAEWGLPAALVLGGLLAWGFVAWTRTARRREGTRAEGARPAEYVALTATLVAAGTHALLCGVSVMPVSQVVGALVIGWALGRHQAYAAAGRGPDARVPAGSARRVAALALALATVTALAAFPDARDLPGRQKAYQAAYAAAPQGAKFFPRFWQAGYLF